MMMAIGERQLQGLGNQMNVLRRVVTEGFEISALQHVQRHRQHRPLRPRTTGMHIDAIEARLHRRLELDTVIGEILHAHEAAVLAMEINDGDGDIAFVKGVARSAQGDTPAFTLIRLLDIGEILQRGGEFGLDEQFARLRRPPLGQINFLV